MLDRNRPGFGLIEAITGLGIGLVGLVLLVPAVQESREAARRANCQGNLKQLALAASNYSLVNDAYPMSVVLGEGTGIGHSCFSQILPYLEQAAVYNGYNFWLESWSDANRTVVGTRVEAYLCPSNEAVKRAVATEVRALGGLAMPGNSKFGPSHYGANWGGVRPASGAEARRDYGGSHRGTILAVVDPEAEKPTRNIHPREVTDGPAFTLLFAEKRASYGWAVGGWGGSEFDVAATPAYPGDDATLSRAFSGSFHPDGINAAFGDGSVRFLKATLDRKTWYAMTTRAGGEVVTFKP